jgi:hypothetical protein
VMGVVATIRVSVIVLVIGLIGSELASERGGRDIYSFLWIAVLD